MSLPAGPVSGRGARPAAPRTRPKVLVSRILNPGSQASALLSIHQLNTHFLACQNIYDARTLAVNVGTPELLTELLDKVVAGEELAYMLQVRLLENLAVAPEVRDALVRMDAINIMSGMLRATDDELVLASLSILMSLTAAGDVLAAKLFGTESNVLLLMELLVRGAEFWRPCVVLLTRVMRFRTLRNLYVASQGKLRSRLNDIIRNQDTPTVIRQLIHTFWASLVQWYTIDQGLEHIAKRKRLRLQLKEQQRILAQREAALAASGRDRSTSRSGPKAPPQMPRSPLGVPLAGEDDRQLDDIKSAGSTLARRNRAGTVVSVSGSK